MRITTSKMLELSQVEDFSQTGYDKIIQSIQNDAKIAGNRPEEYYRCDPRSGLPVLYCPARLKRPNEYREKETLTTEEVSCPICCGDTTHIWDAAKLREGYTFINGNLFPGTFPGKSKTSSSVFGTHFVQWHSSLHDRDYHNLDPEDIAVGLQRVAILEELLLTQSNSFFAVNTDVSGAKKLYGYVGIIKNFGREAGCSLSHGHLQVLHSNVMPLRVRQNIEFRRKYQVGFAEFVRLNENSMPIKQYDKVEIYTPFCMRRPLEAIICLRNSHKNYLHQLDPEEIAELSQALHELAQAVLLAMPREFGKEASYNVLFHNGPIGGFYVEFLPCTQKMGGYEHLGIYFCHQTPQQSTQMYREIFV